MKKIITVYENKKNMKKFELVKELTMGDKVCLEDMETGEQKFYAPSTLKKNFFKTEKVVETPDPNPNEYEPQLRACLIRNEVSFLEDVTYRETGSYIGFNFGKKSVAQIAYNKKRLTVSVNSDEFFTYLQGFEEMHDAMYLSCLCFQKIAPAKYGWRMDCEIDVTDLTNKDIVVIIKAAVEAHRAVIG